MTGSKSLSYMEPSTWPRWLRRLSLITAPIFWPLWILPLFLLAFALFVTAPILIPIGLILNWLEDISPKLGDYWSRR